MNRTAAILVSATVAALAAGLGYWWGISQPQPQAANGSRAQQAKPEAAKGRILYYRNPMGLPDTSPVPKKDPMGMDYIPVYEGDPPESGAPLVRISTDKVQKLGVKTERAVLRVLAPTIRAVATVQADERRLHTVAPKFEGWIQKLHVNTTGQTVARGQPLMDVYSPDLVAAQQEYLIAVKGVGAVQGAAPEVRESMRELRENALVKLRNWDISDLELRQLQDEGKPHQFVTLRSHANGVVLEKMAVEGKRFMAGEMLFQIADLSSVWLLADVFEQDLGAVRSGHAATIRIAAYPDTDFKGRVTFVYPTVTPETRTAKVRIEMPNPGARLKPSMYAAVEIAAGSGHDKTLAIPDSAVLDTGTRQLVIVRRGEGAFEPRTVTLGRRADGYVQVREGLADGDEVVVSANFLIDAESNLKAALAGFGSSEAGAKAPGNPAAAPPAHTGH
jgi:membrane fusion protein, copper/silver efflux system